MNYINEISDKIKNRQSPFIIREKILEFRRDGISKEALQETLETLALISTAEEKDIIWEILDFFVGWCRPDLKID